MPAIGQWMAVLSVYMINSIIRLIEKSDDLCFGTQSQCWWSCMFSSDVDAVNREACERFAAGYIQCMHDVHTFMSSCPGIDQELSAELLNHLLESLPLNEQNLVPDAASHHPGRNSTYAPQMAGVSPSPFASSTDDLSSDLDETDSEHSQRSNSEEGRESHGTPHGVHFSKVLWRPW